MVASSVSSSTGPASISPYVPSSASRPSVASARVSLFVSHSVSASSSRTDVGELEYGIVAAELCANVIYGVILLLQSL